MRILKKMSIFLFLVGVWGCSAQSVKNFGNNLQNNFGDNRVLKIISSERLNIIGFEGSQWGVVEKALQEKLANNMFIKNVVTHLDFYRTGGEKVRFHVRMSEIYQKKTNLDNQGPRKCRLLKIRVVVSKKDTVSDAGTVCVSKKKTKKSWERFLE